jgi:PPOX class probable FMN-dependent enzyme
VSGRPDPGAPVFEDEITDVAALRALYPPTSPRAAAKVIDHIDPICRRYIAASPFLLIATRGSDGRMDVSPKGDPPGFVSVLGPRHVAIPDRPGNNRLDSFENILCDPQIGLLFLIPGHRDTLRVAGRGRLVADAPLLADLSVDGRPARLALVVEVEEVFTHCPKCAIRSGIWDPARWPDLSQVPSLAEALVAHAGLDAPEGEVAAALETGNREQLY